MSKLFGGDGEGDIFSFVHLELELGAQHLPVSRTGGGNLHTKYELLTPTLSWLSEVNCIICLLDIFYNSRHAY